MQESPIVTGRHECSDETRGRRDEESSADIRTRLRTSHVLLCVIRCCSSWGDSMWHFTMGISLVVCAPGTLRLTAIHGFTYAGARLLFGAVVDRWTETTNRGTVTRVLVIARHIAVAVSTLTVTFLLTGQVGAQATGDGPAKTAAQCVIVTASAIAGVASHGSQTFLKRFWALSLIDKDTTTLLFWVDEFCRVVAPLLTGYLMTALSLHFVATCVTYWSIAMIFVELFMHHFTYKLIPDGLAIEVPSHRDDLKETSALLTAASCRSAGWIDKNGAIKRMPVTSEGNSAGCDDQSVTRDGCCPLLLNNFSMLWRGWRTYWNHAASGAGLALALLYLGVVRLDNIVVGFAKDRGMAEVVLGMFLSGSVLLATLGNAILSPLRGKIGLQKTGLLAVLITLVFLTLSVASLLMPDNAINLFFDRIPNDGISSGHVNLAAWRFSDPKGIPSLPLLLLVTGIAMGSFGIGLAEAAVTSLQEDASSGPNNEVVRKVQRALNLTARQAKWMLVMTLPWPQTFGLILLLTFCCVFIAACLFTSGSAGNLTAGHRGYNSLFFAVATEPQRRFTNSCNVPLNL